MIVVKQNNGTTFYGPNISTNGLIMYLDAANINSYVTSATAWNDLLQNYNTTLYNTPSYNSFNYGNIFFDGINEYLSLNNTLNLNTQTGFTVDMVININKAQTTYPNNWTYFYANGANFESGVYYTSPGVNNQFIFKDNTIPSQVASGFIAGSWYNITFGCNSLIPFMYQNGILVGTASAFSSATWSISKLLARQSDISRFFSANLGLIRVYNRALSASEVFQNYMATKSRFALNDNYWNAFKRNVATIYDVVVNPDGELIWNTLPYNMASAYSLQITPYAMINGAIIAGDSVGNTLSITHTRGSNATFVDKDGYIKYAPHNLITYSELLSNSSWNKTNVLPVYNTAVAPDGTLTATKMISNTASSVNHYFGQNGFTSVVGQQYTISIYAKAGEYTRIKTSANGPYSYPTFDLIYGSFSNASGYISSSMSYVGNGWWRCSSTYIAVATTAWSAWYLDNGTTYTFTGDGVSGVYVWGSSLIANPAPNNYIKTAGAAAYLPRWTYDPYTADYLGWLIEPTAATNLLTYASDYTNAVWTKSSFSVATNSNVLSLDGFNYTNIITNTNTQPQLIQNIGTPSNSGNYIISCFIKPISQQYIYLQAQSYGTVTNYSRISFDLFNLSATFSDTGGTGYTASTSKIEPYRDGWYRISATFILPVDGSRIVLGFSKTYGAYTALDTGVVNQIYLWGFQTETGDKASYYIPTYASQVTRNADNFLIPTTAGQYLTSGACYLEASTQRLNNGASRWLYMTSGSGNILYSSSDNAGNQVITWDGVNAASKSSTGYPTTTMSKMFSSWGNTYGLKVTQNALTVATASFDGSMGLSNSVSITFGGDGNSSNNLIRTCLLFSKELPDSLMQDWTNSSKFQYETPYKAFKANLYNIYFIPEGDSQYQRLSDYIRNNFSGILLGAAFKGNTIYALNNNGGLISYNHTRGSIATQINRNGFTEFCAHNLMYASEDITATYRIGVSTTTNFLVGATISATNGSIGTIIYIDNVSSTKSLGVYTTFSSFSGTITQATPSASATYVSGNGNWLHNNCIVTNNATASSNGDIKAELITATGTGTHGPVQTIPLAKNRAYTLSTLIKPAGSSRIQISINAYSSNNISLNINLTTGVPVITPSTSGGGLLIAYSCVSESNGWYRANLSGVPSQYDTVGSGLDFTLSILNSSGNSSYTAGTESMYITETQLGYYPNPNIYIPTLSSQIYAPRYSYNATTKTYEGWLFEGASTNGIRNSSIIGATMTGLTGSTPTNWSIQTTTSRGLTGSIVGTGYDNGMPYIDVRYYGIGIAGSIELYPEAITQNAGTQSSIWTTSWFLKTINSGPSSLNLSILEWNSSSVYLTEGTSANLSLSGNLTRYTWTRALTNASTAYVSCSLRFDVLTGTSYDFTIRIAGPQLERAPVATSYIPTYLSQVTRTADTFAAASSNNMLNLGTLYANLKTGKWVTSSTVHTFTDIGNSSIPFWTNNVATRIQATEFANGSVAINANPGSFLENNMTKMALTWGNGTWQMSGRGQTGAPGFFGGTFGTGILSIPALTSANNVLSVNVLTFANIPLKLNDTDLRNLTI